MANRVIDVTTKVMDTTVTKMTVAFKGNEKKNHKGVDLIPKSTSETPNILAYDSGTVVQVQNLSGTNDDSRGNAGMGTSIGIKHTNGTVTRYQHLKYNSLKVKKGDKVKKGQIIGVYGRPTTGNSTGPHLHFDISLDSLPKTDYIKGTFCGETRYYVDPIPYLTAQKSDTKKESASKETKKEYKVTASILNVRSGSSTNFSVVGHKKQNDTVTVYEIKNGFGRIGNGQWCSMNYLKEKS